MFYRQQLKNWLGENYITTALINSLFIAINNTFYSTNAQVNL